MRRSAAAAVCVSRHCICIGSRTGGCAAPVTRPLARTHALQQTLRAFFAAAEIQTRKHAAASLVAPAAAQALITLSNCNFSTEDESATERVRTTKFRGVCMTVKAKDTVVIFGR